MRHAVFCLALVILVAGCAGSARDLRIRLSELPQEQREEAAVVAAAYEADPRDAAVLYQVAATLAPTGRTQDV